MRQIDCYYIRGKGKDSRCTKIHGVGIGYNVCKTLIYCKVVGTVSATLAVPSITVYIGLGVAQGFFSAAREFLEYR